jgi:hypothetical protein
MTSEGHGHRGVHEIHTNIDPWKSTDQKIVRPKGTREDHTLHDETTSLNGNHPLREGNDTNKALPVVDHLPRD